MWGLIYKDICSCKKNIIITIIATVFLSLVNIFINALLFFNQELLEEAVISSQLFDSMLFMLIFMTWNEIISKFIETDERAVWINFVTSSPVNVKGSVQSKYCEVLLIALICTAWCSVISSIETVFSGQASAVSLICNIMFIFLFISAIDLPFILYFGSKYGGYVKLGLLLFASAGFIIYILYGDANNGLEHIWEKFFSENQSKKMFVFQSLAPYAVGVIYYISYRISCKIYSKGAEKYE